MYIMESRVREIDLFSMTTCSSSSSSGRGVACISIYIKMKSSNDFFQTHQEPEWLASCVEQVKTFVHQFSGKKTIVLVTSGGTTVPLEKNTVRFIDNFSGGTRGSCSAEEFLKQGYAVIFAHRKNSLQPFSRHLLRRRDRSKHYYIALAAYAQVNVASINHIASYQQACGSMGLMNLNVFPQLLRDAQLLSCTIGSAAAANQQVAEWLVDGFAARFGGFLGTLNYARKNVAIWVSGTWLAYRAASIRQWFSGSSPCRLYDWQLATLRFRVYVLSAQMLKHLSMADDEQAVWQNHTQDASDLCGAYLDVVVLNAYQHALKKLDPIQDAAAAAALEQCRITFALSRIVKYMTFYRNQEYFRAATAIVIEQERACAVKQLLLFDEVLMESGNCERTNAFVNAPIASSNDQSYVDVIMSSKL